MKKSMNIVEKKPGYKLIKLNFSGLANSMRFNFVTLGRRMLLPNDADAAITVCAGKGRHSQDGAKGKMACLVQFLYRLLYARKVKPDLGNFEFKIFKLSPLGVKVIEAMAHYDPEWGINFIDTMRKFMNIFTTGFMRFYIPPETERQGPANSRK